MHPQQHEGYSQLVLEPNRSLAVFRIPQSELSCEVFFRSPIFQRLHQLVPRVDFRKPFIIGQVAWETFQERLNQLAPEEPAILFCSLAGSQFLSISQQLLYHVFYQCFLFCFLSC